jgi:hypothetical protein
VGNRFRARSAVPIPAVRPSWWGMMSTMANAQRASVLGAAWWAVVGVIGCKGNSVDQAGPPAKAVSAVQTSVAKPIVQPITPVRSCNTLQDNKRASDDIAATISSARTLAQTGKLSEALAEAGKAREIEATCFGALEPRTNWGKIDGELYAIDAIRRFPDIPVAWLPRCARKAGMLEPVGTDWILCGPGFLYCVDHAGSVPFALQVSAWAFEDEPLSADACDEFVEKTITGVTTRASMVSDGGSMRFKWYERAGVLIWAAWSRDKGKTMCLVNSCRQDAGRASLGGRCEIPPTARMLRPSEEKKAAADAGIEGERLTLRCEPYRATTDGEITFPHAGDPVGAALPNHRYVLAGAKLHKFVGSERSPSTMAVTKNDDVTLIAKAKETSGGVVTSEVLTIDKNKLTAVDTFVSARSETSFYVRCRKADAADQR